mmetsp:Transcript_92867/g.160776  ORF Transcript_92867/g.160776 Transcript_92867/m.160776 type:complete len:421 (+) Transcript_92867:85-1347(+)
MMHTTDLVAVDDTLDESDSAWSRREAARLKQIQIGKARPEYQRYVREVPYSERRASQPSTPDPRARVSKRQFDRLLGDWRRRLHEFDSVPRLGQYDAGYTGSSIRRGGHKKSGAASISENGHRGAQPDGRGSAAGLGGQRSGAARRARPRDAAREAKVERSAAKLEGCEPAAGTPEEMQPQLVQPQEVLAASQAGAVKISLADQLFEMPQLAAQMPLSDSWMWCEEMDMSWSPEAMQQMSMVTPSPHKPVWTERADGYTPNKEIYPGMPEESLPLPHKLFEESPGKNFGLPFETGGSNFELAMSMQASTQPSVDMLRELGAGDQAQLHMQVPQPLLAEAQVQPSSPRTPRGSPEQPQEVKNLQASPKQTGTPLPTTPRHRLWVPETPSPNGMYSMAQNTMQLPFSNPPVAEFNPYFSMLQ